MKIGIDIDEIVVEFFRKYLEFFNRQFQKNLMFEDLVSYNIWDVSNISKEDVLSSVREFYDSIHFDEVALVEGVREALIEISKENDIFFITSRPKIIEDKTHFFLNNLLGEINFKLHFSGGTWEGSKAKGDLCKEIGIDFFIEDNSNYALGCAENGIQTFLFDKPWNKDCVEHENIVRVKNWKAILEKLGGENG